MCSVLASFGFGSQHKRGSKLRVGWIIGIAIGLFVLMCVILLLLFLRPRYRARPAANLNPFPSDTYRILPSVDQNERTHLTSTNPMHATSVDDIPPTYESLPSLSELRLAGLNATIV